MFNNIPIWLNLLKVVELMTHNPIDPFVVNSTKIQSCVADLARCLLNLLLFTVAALAHCSNQIISLALNIAYLSAAKQQIVCINIYKNLTCSQESVNVCVRDRNLSYCFTMIWSDN